MADLKGTIRLDDGDGLHTTLRVHSGRLVVTAGEHEIGNWAVNKLAVRRRNNEFHIDVDGEELVMHVDDPVALAQEIGLGMGQIEKEKGGKARTRFKKMRRAKADSAPSEPPVKRRSLSERMGSTAANDQPATVAAVPTPHQDPPPDPFEEEPQPSVPDMPEPIEISLDSVDEPEGETAPPPHQPVQEEEQHTEFEILPLPIAFESEEGSEPPADPSPEVDETAQEAESLPEASGLQTVESDRDEEAEQVVGSGLRPIDEMEDDGHDVPEVSGLQPVESDLDEEAEQVAGSGLQPIDEMDDDGHGVPEAFGLQPVESDLDEEAEQVAGSGLQPIDEVEDDDLREPEAFGLQPVESDLDEEAEQVAAPGLQPIEEMDDDGHDVPEASVLQPFDLTPPAAVIPEAEEEEPESEFIPEPAVEPAAVVEVEQEKPAGPSLWKRIPLKWKAAGAGVLVLSVLGIVLPNLLALLLFVAGMGILFLAVAAKSDSGTAIMPPAFFGTDLAIFSGIGMVILAAVIMVVA